MSPVRSSFKHVSNVATVAVLLVVPVPPFAEVIALVVLFLIPTVVSFTSTVSVQGTVSTETLQSFIHELLEVLYRREVSLIEAGPSSFDYNQQKAIGVVDVTDPAEHQRVHKVVRRGFRLGERTLRPEEVIVCRVLTPPPGVKLDANEGHKS